MQPVGTFVSTVSASPEAHNIRKQKTQYIGDHPMVTPNAQDTENWGTGWLQLLSDSQNFTLLSGLGNKASL